MRYIGYRDGEKNTVLITDEEKIPTWFKIRMDSVAETKRPSGVTIGWRDGKEQMIASDRPSDLEFFAERMDRTEYIHTEEVER